MKHYFEMDMSAIFFSKSINIKTDLSFEGTQFQCLFKCFSLTSSVYYPK